MQGYKIISDKISANVPLFLQVEYLQIIRKFNKPLIFTNISEQYTSPTQYLFLTIYPSTNKLSIFIDKITISTDSTTINTFPSPYVTQTDFLTTIFNIIKGILANFYDKYVKQNAKFKEELMDFNKKHTESNIFSSEHIENELLTLTSETSSSEYCFDTKLQANFDKNY